MPRAPLPTTGVTFGSEMSRIPSAGVTLPSSLLRAHAPIPNPPPASGCHLGQSVFAGCRQPLLGVGFFRVGEEVAPLTPHRPERAQLTHSVLRRTDSLTLRHSDGQSWAEVVGIFPISSRTRPTTHSSHSTCAITHSANTAVPDGLGRLCP
jgi:hypothetical protein